MSNNPLYNNSKILVKTRCKRCILIYIRNNENTWTLLFFTLIRHHSSNRTGIFQKVFVNFITIHVKLERYCLAIYSKVKLLDGYYLLKRVGL